MACWPWRLCFGRCKNELDNLFYYIMQISIFFVSVCDLPIVGKFLKVLNLYSNQNKSRIVYVSRNAKLWWNIYEVNPAASVNYAANTCGRLRGEILIYSKGLRGLEIIITNWQLTRELLPFHKLFRKINKHWMFTSVSLSRRLASQAWPDYLAQP